MSMYTEYERNEATNQSTRKEALKPMNKGNPSNQIRKQNHVPNDYRRKQRYN
jgi:hypothetical protein